MSTHQPRMASSSKSRTLEYRQAMKDFHVMFPNLEKNVIECVLRSNGGHVDSTIDQLLQITQDNPPNHRRRLNQLYHTYDDSTDSSCSISPELNERTSSSEDDVARTHAPPRYTPRYDRPPPAFDFSTRPAQVVDKKSHTSSNKTYRDWNPPMLGILPPDFLRIYPVNSSDMVSTANSRSSYRTSSHKNQHRSELPDKHSNRNHHPIQRRRTTGQLNVLFDDPSSHHQRMVMIDSPRERRRASQRTSTTSELRRHKRSTAEQEQYEEDRKIALLLQNEEFLKELKRNDDFLRELNSVDRPAQSLRTAVPPGNPRDRFAPIHIDPLTELPKPQTSEVVPEEDAFRESVKHMSKSARKTFHEIARNFRSKKKSYKSMNNIDPAFANCSDNDEFR